MQEAGREISDNPITDNRRNNQDDNAGNHFDIFSRGQLIFQIFFPYRLL